MPHTHEREHKRGATSRKRGTVEGEGESENARECCHIFHCLRSIGDGWSDSRHDPVRGLYGTRGVVPPLWGRSGHHPTAPPRPGSGRLRVSDRPALAAGCGGGCPGHFPARPGTETGTRPGYERGLKIGPRSSLVRARETVSPSLTHGA